MRISEWSSDLCSSDLVGLRIALSLRCVEALIHRHAAGRLARGVDHVVVQEQHGAELDDAEEQHQEDRQHDGELHGGGAAACALPPVRPPLPGPRSEEHTSELQSLMRISYAVFCLKKKKNTLK